MKVLRFVRIESKEEVGDNAQRRGKDGEKSENQPLAARRLPHGFRLVRPEGLEPPTSRSEVCCSVQLS